jgi:uncharacterized phiE125 gp8 family phage protein
VEYNLTLVTPPAVEPITTTQAISYGRLETLSTAETAFLTGLIVAAREYCEAKQNRAYITQTWQISLCKWPKVIEIPKGRLKTVTSVKYTDSAGVVHTLIANTDYIVSLRGILGRITPPYGCNCPTAALYPLDPIVIEFTCGYGAAGTDVPLRVIQAMYMLVMYWWDNRPASKLSVEVEAAVNNLLSLDRISNV